MEKEVGENMHPEKKLGKITQQFFQQGKIPNKIVGRDDYMTVKKAQGNVMWNEIQQVKIYWSCKFVLGKNN